MQGDLSCPQTEFKRGMALHEAGQVGAAIEAFSEALRMAPGQVDSTVALCHCLLDAGRAGEAQRILAQALLRHPCDPRILILDGRALLAAGSVKAAVDALALALASSPRNAAAHTGMANALVAAGAVERAMRHSLEAFRLVPDAAHASNFSGVLIRMGHFQEALVVAEHAISRQTGHFGALVNRANALEGLARWDESLAACRQAVAADPANPIGRLKLATGLLRNGQMTAEAWDLYEWRLMLQCDPTWLAGARWNGEEITGKTILLHAEQGFGDTLQFVRYAPMVAARAGRVILAVQPPLARLLRAVPGVDQVVATKTELPVYDVVCPLLSLPRIFGTNLDEIPPPVPYAALARAPLTDGSLLRVGLVWAGSRDFAYDQQRSLAARDLDVLAGVPGVQFYSLQMHEPGREALPAALGAIDLMAGVQDFAETAARIGGLDLVIAVDTAVAHLAATMDKPVWLLSRARGCWRWLHGRTDSPWYPSLRVVRQVRPNDWDGALAEIRRGLTALAAPDAASPRSARARVLA